MREVSLAKGQLGLELEELEAAALLVQEEETAGDAARSPCTQPTPCCALEPSDCEGSEGSESSGSEDSASEQDALAEPPHVPGASLQGPFLAESGALPPAGGRAGPRAAVGQEALLASAQEPAGRRPLIEELGDHLRTTLQISTSEGAAARGHSGTQDGDRQLVPGTGSGQALLSGNEAGWAPLPS